MRVALAQIAPVVGDFDGNLTRIRDAKARAAAEDADLVVLPELCLTGYPPLDLLERPEFLARNREALQQLAADTADGPAVVAGFVDRNAGDRGKPLHNGCGDELGDQYLCIQCLLDLQEEEE